MLHKLISMASGLLIFTCISGALAAPTQLAESVKTGNADTYVIEGETYEDDFQKEYEEPAPALTNEEMHTKNGLHFVRRSAFHAM